MRHTAILTSFSLFSLLAAAQCQSDTQAGLQPCPPTVADVLWPSLCSDACVNALPSVCACAAWSAIPSNISDANSSDANDTDANATDSYECQLYAAAGAQQAADGKCSAVLQCDTGVQSGAQNIVATKPANGEGECANLCRNAPGCGAYEYTASAALDGLGKCDLKAALRAKPDKLGGKCSAETRCRGFTMTNTTELDTLVVSGGDRECAWHCRSTPGCVAYVLDTNPQRVGHQECTLYSDVVAEDSGAEYHCLGAMQCDTSSDASGTVISTLAVSDDVACSRECANRTDCRGYRMRSAGGILSRPVCDLLGGHITSVARPAQSDVCSHWMQCLPQVSATSAVALQAIPVQSGDAECALACRSHKGCSFWQIQYSDNPAWQNCSLMQSVGGTGAPSSLSCFGVTQCSALKKLGSWDSNKEFSVHGGDSECAALCATTAGCLGFDVVTEVGKFHVQKCRLTTNLTSFDDSSDPDVHCASGSQCVSATQATPLAASDVLQQVKIMGGASECARLCRSQSGCVAWNIGNLTGALHENTCVLLRSVGNVTSVGTVCFGRSHCNTMASTLSDPDASLPKKVYFGDNECSALCRSTTNCTAFVYDDVVDPFYNCWLKISSKNATSRSSSCFGQPRCTPNVGMPSSLRAAHLLETRSVFGADVECEELCKHNQSCLSFVVIPGKSHLTQLCELWNVIGFTQAHNGSCTGSLLVNFGNSSSSSSLSSSSSPKGSKLELALIIGIAVGGTVALFLLLGLIICCCERRKRKQNQKLVDDIDLTADYSDW